MEDKDLCTYVRRDGSRCSSVVHSGSKFCFWHDRSIKKDQPDAKEKLLQWIIEGNSLEGVSLAKADLSGFQFPRGVKVNRSFVDAELNHTNLQGAHLFGVNFTSASLLKADLTGANLNRCILQETNLLAVKLHDTKLEGVTWGKNCRQEAIAKQFYRQRKLEEARQNFTEAEEIYRGLRLACEERGLYSESGHFHYREKKMHQHLLPKYSLAWWLSKLVDLVCGFGESSLKVVLFALLVIFISAFMYSFLTLNSSGVLTDLSTSQSFFENLTAFGNCLYYSVVTFTTLGYGEITPVGLAKFVAATEAFIGAFSMALFVVLFVGKMTK